MVGDFARRYRSLARPLAINSSSPARIGIPQRGQAALLGDSRIWGHSETGRCPSVLCCLSKLRVGNWSMKTMYLEGYLAYRNAALRQLVTAASGRVWQRLEKISQKQGQGPASHHCRRS